MNNTVMYKGIGTCEWFSACKSHLVKLNLMKFPKFVSGYTEFTSFSARMNGHDGSAVRYTKQVRDGVPLLGNFHKHEGIGYINDRFGAYQQPPLIWFKIFNFRSWPQMKDHQQIMGMIHSEEL